jgi:plastocyanin
MARTLPTKSSRGARLLQVFSLATLVACGTHKSPTEPENPNPNPAPTNHLVVATNFMFSPRQMTIHVGDTVTFRNDEGFHNVVADDGSFRCASGCSGSQGDPSTGWSFQRTFSAAGAVPFFCEVHGGRGGTGMSGMIMVTN